MEKDDNIEMQNWEDGNLGIYGGILCLTNDSEIEGCQPKNYTKISSWNKI